MTDGVPIRRFAQRTVVAEAWAWIDEQTRPLDAESVPLLEAAGRVLAAGITSEIDVPGFDRAMMDGLRNSIIIGIAVVLISVPVGLAAAIIMSQIYHRARSLYYLVTISPLGSMMKAEPAAVTLPFGGGER